jgi:hypothetical protein
MELLLFARKQAVEGKMEAGKGLSQWQKQKKKKFVLMISLES